MESVLSELSIAMVTYNTSFTFIKSMFFAFLFEAVRCQLLPVVGMAAEVVLLCGREFDGSAFSKLG